MTEMDDLRRTLAETKRGAAAIGVCIARTFAESDPTLATRLSQTANEMYRSLCDRGEAHAGEMVFLFGRALVEPTFFPPEK
jgi:hypothetical protein